MPTVALIISLVGATAVMISPISPWTKAVALHGLALVVAGLVVLAWWLLRDWDW